MVGNEMPESCFGPLIGPLIRYGVGLHLLWASGLGVQASSVGKILDYSSYEALACHVKLLSVEGLESRLKRTPTSE